jgi:hypothetical protein
LLDVLVRPSIEMVQPILTEFIIEKPRSDRSRESSVLPITLKVDFHHRSTNITRVPSSEAYGLACASGINVSYPWWLLVSLEELTCPGLYLEHM